MAKTYTSGEEPKSAIRKQGFQGFLSSMFGWRRSPDPKKQLDFITVDASSEERLTQANAAERIMPGKLSTKLDELFESWLHDTSDSLKELMDRARRVDALTYAKLNDPFIGKVCKLYADEATQMDVQDHLIGIETPDPRMTREMYRLLGQWGITQQRIHAAIEQLASYGDCFWSNKITEAGVERIVPLKQLQVSDRLEFNPVDAMEKMKRQDGSFSSLSDRHSLIQTMLDDMESTEDFSSLFDTKLFGFALQNDLVVPPWAISHFRVSSDASEFYPFGVSPILGTLAPFKLTASSITLQSIARVLSFPVTLYKVKTSESADEGRQFSTVERVREAYDNIGVTPNGGNSEVYTVNTKIWMPDGLLDVDVKASQVDIGFIEDIKMYAGRTATASGVPQGYFSDEWGQFSEASGVSLVEQSKPFARATYSLQSAFLDGLSDLYRLHFAINGLFDFRTPFTLSLKFPAESVSDNKNSARKSSLEMATSVLDMIRTAIGSDEEEGLPPDIVRDVISKYTFLDPQDIVKWTRDASYSSATKDSSDDGSDSEPDLEGDMEDDEEASGDSDIGSIEDIDFGESNKRRANRIREARFKELNKRYKESAGDLYFRVLQESAIGDFVRDKNHVHISAGLPSYSDLMLESIEKNRKGDIPARLQEFTIREALQQVKEDNATNL